MKKTKTISIPVKLPKNVSIKEIKLSIEVVAKKNKK